MEKETAQHALVCNNVDMRTEFSEAIGVLEKWLFDKETCPDIADCIISTLAQHTPTAFGLAADPTAAEAAREQDCIGWTNMFEGKISKLWRARQDSFYRATESRKTSRSWAHGLVRQLLEFTHRMWMKRNSIRHSRAEGEGTIVDERTNDQLIMEQFEWGTEGLARQDHHLIEDDELEDVLKLSALSKIVWLKDINAARTAEDARQRTELGRMRTNMTGWLNPQGGNDNLNSTGQNNSVTQFELTYGLDH